MKSKYLLPLLGLCLLFLLPLSLCAQEPVCGKCLKKKSNCPYRCNHPTCKTCGKVCGAKNNPCPYGGKHPKCSVCGKLKENCAYKGKHSTCSTCGRVCGAKNNPCPYGGKHPKPKVVFDGRDKTYTANGVSFTMKPVAGGTFTMGATSEQKNSDDDEKPKHTVTLSDYYIGETEVTQELWAAVMGSNPSHFTGNMQRPVERVSWDDCQTFIRKLNELTGANFRLPTEAEWEFAARGGRNSRGYQYSGSSNIGDVAWYDDNSSDTTHPVKTKSPNELGIYDMSGNVWEWCQDWRGPYSSSSQTNPTGPSTGSGRVYRGGSWFNFVHSCRSAYRYSSTPDFRDDLLGLRLSL